MASGFSDKAPPPFNAITDDFNKWENKFLLWKDITDVPKTKHGPLLVLQLDDDTQDTILELISRENLKKEDGAEQVVNNLKEIFKKEESVAAFELYEEFRTYKRPANMCINKFCSEFQKKLSKVMASGTTLSENVLAFKLLKAAKVTERQEQLIRATISEINYENMVKQF